MIFPWNLGGVAVTVDFLPPILWPVAMREKLLGNQNWGEMARLRNHVWWSNSDNSGRVPENRHHSWLWSGPERRNNPWIAASPRPVASIAPGRRSKAPFPSRQNSTRRRDSRLRLVNPPGTGEAGEAKTLGTHSWYQSLCCKTRLCAARGKVLGFCSFNQGYQGVSWCS